MGGKISPFIQIFMRNPSFLKKIRKRFHITKTKGKDGNLLQVTKLHIMQNVYVINKNTILDIQNAQKWRGNIVLNC